MTKQRLIGISISEAIDWTQDKLESTRPIAEQVLFSMLADRKVFESEDGYVLNESEDDDGDERDMTRRKAFRMNRVNTRRIRMRLAPRRRGFQERHQMLHQRLHDMGYTDAAGDMEEADHHHGRVPTEKKRLPPGWLP